MEKFYDVETYDEREQRTLKIESFSEMLEAKEYMVRTIKHKLIDHFQKLILVKRVYDGNRELLDEETIVEFSNNYDDELTEFILLEVKK